ncbi:hypothetical protein EMN47_06395 [Prolixibacteraceae bacterium JC049]|nr:hypothetical protein [Prolixibacteraceae bacterium JC049]
MKLAAHYILQPERDPIKYGIVTLSEKNEVISISEGAQNIQEQAQMKFYPGAILVGTIVSPSTLQKKEKLPVDQLFTQEQAEKPAIWWATGIDLKTLQLTTTSKFKQLI